MDFNKQKGYFVTMSGEPINIEYDDKYFGFLTPSQRSEVADIISDQHDDRRDYLVNKIMRCSGDFWHDHRNKSVSEVIDFYREYEKEHY